MFRVAAALVAVALWLFSRGWEQSVRLFGFARRRPLAFAVTALAIIGIIFAATHLHRTAPPTAQGGDGAVVLGAAATDTGTAGSDVGSGQAVVETLTPVWEQVASQRQQKGLVMVGGLVLIVIVVVVIGKLSTMRRSRAVR